MYFDSIYITPRVRVALGDSFERHERERFWDLVKKLRQGQFDIPGLNVEKLYTKRGKLYSARLNIDLRVLFSLYAREGEKAIVIWGLDHHDKAYRLAGKILPEFAFNEADKAKLHFEQMSQCEFSQSLDPKDLTEGLLLFKVPEQALEKAYCDPSFDGNCDRFLSLSREQEAILAVKDRAYLVQGAAGSGKTTLALYYCLRIFESAPFDDVFFFTYQDDLALVCRNYLANMVGASAADEKFSKAAEDLGRPGPKVFSFLSFCRNYIWANLSLQDVGWRWIDKKASLKHLQKVLAGRPRWQRLFSPEQIWGYIYSIFKGRFVPGSDRLGESPEDYQKILKGYAGDFALTFAEEILEIIASYQKRLRSLNEKDEADLIYYCYQKLKQNAVISSADRPTWIVIDEIQDFTELEWKSILLFWENKIERGPDFVTYPFLSGDVNQNISRSGFRWQEADSYIDAILRKAHRPNKLVRVELDANLRNSRQIFALGKFIREKALKGNLGSEPNFDGPKPQLVVGEPDQFLAFLKAIEAVPASDNPDNELAAPLVVLMEDEADRARFWDKRPGDEQHVLLSLAKCKGLEFEDCIVYRLFASAGNLANQENEGDWTYLSLARLFDLWYMAVTRARRGLLVFLTPEELDFARRLFADNFAAFCRLFNWPGGDVESCLHNFFAGREKYLPNYHAVFIERARAQSLWDEAGKSALENLEGKACAAREKALKLWHKCRDWQALGMAYMSLGDYQKAVPYFEKSMRPLEMGKCYENLCRFELAASCYREAGKVLLAANAWVQAGFPEKAAPVFEEAGEFLQAGECYMQKGKWEEAAFSFAKAKHFDRAAELFEKSGNEIARAESLQNAGKNIEAAHLFEKLGLAQEAAQNFEQAGELLQASLQYEAAGHLDHALLCARLSGDLSRQAELLEKSANHREAARLSCQLKDKARALSNAKQSSDYALIKELQADAGDWLGYAQSCHMLGEHKAAAEQFAGQGKWMEAAACYAEANEWKQSADCYVKAESWFNAAHAYEKCNQNLLAAKIYQKIFKSQEAARCLERAGKHFQAAELYELGEDWEKAARSYKHCRQLKKAAKAFERAKMWKQASEMYKILGDQASLKRCEGYERWLT